ncbi:MAG: bifunctional glycosyltransferase family 2/GtrA family protein [Lachnospiraceae bacterium]|nr:bifunctional glycosyltransferase family 2/GtrA family protein [Lachnospiraceae bacterium]
MDKELPERGQTWIVLIPAYQPGPLLLDLLREVRKNGLLAVVVDDGSGEEARELFQQASEYAVVLRHPENRGKGSALKSGLRYMQNHFGADYVVVTMDADGQHRVSDVLRVCRDAQEHPGSLVLGCRRMKKGVPLRSRFGNTLTRLVFSLCTDSGLYDTQTGLRAFNSTLARELIGISGERYEYEMHVLLECSEGNIPVREVEVETVYLDGNASSHFDIMRDSYRIYKEILKFSASSFLSFLLDYALYSLLLVLTGNLTASNIGARVMSAGFNYSLNRRLVFCSDSRVENTIWKYWLLAAAILAGNTLVLGMLVNGAGVNRYVAKLCTELTFFLLSWLVQRCVIFRKKERAT